ncbi:MAG: ABC transporter permease [Bacilli bacterium]|nr:ABC transporter permease [Bacilli bacterium]
MISREGMHESPFHISARLDLTTSQKWIIKAIGIVVGLVICALVCAIINPGTFFSFFGELFVGCFSSVRKVLNLFEEMAVLLLISVALAPAFKMKFWNIGAEGQVLMGALGCTFVMFKIAPELGNGFGNVISIILELSFAVLFGVIWAAIPAIFKAFFGTNETLFTLMMNYIAKGIVVLMISIWIKSGSGIIPALQYGRLPTFGGYKYILNIIIVAILVVALSLYLLYSKHGYEISVIGGSVNTARYVGINVKKVTIRTMILCGALCGVAGFLITAGGNYSVSDTSAGGRGFTAILICWLSNFDPLEMTLTSFLVSFITNGSKQAESTFHSSGSFVDIMIGVFFFVIIASTFFMSYRVKFIENFKKWLKKVFSKKEKKEVVE